MKNPTSEGPVTGHTVALNRRCPRLAAAFVRVALALACLVALPAGARDVRQVARVMRCAPYYPSTTNLIPYSEPLLSQTLDGGVTQGAGIANGMHNGVTFPAGGSSVDYAYLTGVTVLGATVYTISTYVEMEDAGVPTTADFGFVVGGDAVDTSGAVIVPAGGVVYRVSLTVTTPAVPSSGNAGILRTDSHSRRGFTATGLQLEAGRLTPYFQNGSGSPLTRAAGCYR